MQKEGDNRHVPDEQIEARLQDVLRSSARQPHLNVPGLKSAVVVDKNGLIIVGNINLEDLQRLLGESLKQSKSASN